MLPLMGVSAWSDVEQTAAPSAGITFEFNVELYDTDAIHDNATNTTRFTVPADGAGKWAGFFRVGATATSADDEIQLSWYVNGGAGGITTQNFALIQNVERLCELSFPPTLLAAGDYVEIIALNNESITFGQTYSGSANAPYGPDSGNSPWAVVWRAGL